MCRKLIKLHKPDPTLQIAICADWAIRFKSIESIDLAVYKCIECSHVHCNIDAAFCPNCFYNNVIRVTEICSDFAKSSFGVVVKLASRKKFTNITQVENIADLVGTDDIFLDRLTD